MIQISQESHMRTNHGQKPTRHLTNAGDPLKQAYRLQLRIAKSCVGESVVDAFVALGTVMEGILDDMDDKQLRYLLTIRLIHMFLHLPSFDDLSTWPLQTGSASNGDEVRNAAILAKVKELVAASRSLSESYRPEYQHTLLQPLTIPLNSSMGERPRAVANQIVQACRHLEVHVVLDLLVGVARFYLQQISAPSSRNELALICAGMLASVPGVEAFPAEDLERLFGTTIDGLPRDQRDSVIISVIRALVLASSVAPN
jgi:hypothetical protein